MKYQGALIISLLIGLLAPALPAKSVPRGARASAPVKLLYNPADPNVSGHWNARAGSSAITPVPAAPARAEGSTDLPLQNLGVVSANLPESRPYPSNTFHSFPGSTNPLTYPSTVRPEQKKTK